MSVVLCMSVSACSPLPDAEAKVDFAALSPMPVMRASAACAVVEGTAYVYGGRTKAGISGDLWSYTPSADEWKALPSPPLAPRTGAVALSCGNALFVGLGYGGKGVYSDETYLRDWWRFTPSSGEWKRLADYPSKYTAAASAFAHGGELFVCFGAFKNDCSKVYAYDTEEDSWRLVVDGGLAMTEESVAAEADGRYFAGNSHQWYEFLPATEQWEQRFSCGRSYKLVSSALFSYGHGLYLVGGREWSATSSDGRIFRYDLSADRWYAAGILPPEAGKENMISFVIDGVPYIGLGEDKGRLSAAMYRLTIKR